MEANRWMHAKRVVRNANTRDREKRKNNHTPVAAILLFYSESGGIHPEMWNKTYQVPTVISWELRGSFNKCYAIYLYSLELGNSWRFIFDHFPSSNG